MSPTATPAILVVAATNAWPIYNKTLAYICQPNRSFDLLSHIAFYCDGWVEKIVPRVLGTIESVVMTREGVNADTSLSPTYRTKLLQLISDLQPLTMQTHLGKTQKVMFLSGPEAEHTIRLPHRIQNDKKDKKGKTTAFTMGHRYIATEDLMKFPANTSGLEQH